MQCTATGTATGTVELFDGAGQSVIATATDVAGNLTEISVTDIDVDTVADEYGTGAGCSLREAVQAANDDVAFGGCTAGSGPADAIMLDPGAVYTLGLPGAGEDANATGDLDLETGSGDLSLARDGAGPRPTIDAGDLDGALDVTGGGSLALGSIRVIGGLRFYERLELRDGEAGAVGALRTAPALADLRAALFVDDARQARVEAAVGLGGLDAGADDRQRALEAWSRSDVARSRPRRAAR